MNSESEIQAKPPAPQISILQIWYLALARPSEEAYQTIYREPSASISKSLLWVAVGSLIAGTLAFLAQSGAWARALSQLGDQSQFGDLALGSAVALLCLVPFIVVFAIVGLLIYTGILHFIAGALGGDGRFEDLLYMLATIAAPMSVVNGALGVIPVIGGCLALPLAAYNFYLNGLAIKAVHRFSWGRAIVTLLIPVLVVFLLVIIIFAAFLMPVFGELLRSATPG